MRGVASSDDDAMRVGPSLHMWVGRLEAEPGEMVGAPLVFGTVLNGCE